MSDYEVPDTMLMTGLAGRFPWADALGEEYVLSRSHASGVLVDGAKVAFRAWPIAPSPAPS